MSDAMKDPDDAMDALAKAEAKMGDDGTLQGPASEKVELTQEGLPPEETTTPMEEPPVPVPLVVTLEERVISLERQFTDLVETTQDKLSDFEEIIDGMKEAQGAVGPLTTNSPVAGGDMVTVYACKKECQHNGRLWNPTSAADRMVTLEELGGEVPFAKVGDEITYPFFEEYTISLFDYRNNKNMLNTQ